MNSWHNKDTDKVCRAILSLKTVDEVYSFLDDVCTINEVTDMAQRLKVAQLLREGNGYQQIGEKTEASSATISRVNRCLKYGTGGYKLVLERLSGEGKDD